MATNFSAEIKNLRLVDTSTNFTADTVKNGGAFDVLADIEAGSGINSVANEDQLYVTVRNLSKFTVLATAAPTRVLAPSGNARTETLKVSITAWTGAADPGDVIDAVASYRFEAGIYNAHSSAQSDTSIVTA